MTVLGDGDGNLQLAVVDGLHNIAERLGARRALNGLRVRMRREEHHRRIETAVNFRRRGDAIHPAFQSNVHERDIGSRLFDSADRRFSRGRGADHVMTQTLEALLQVHRHDRLVLDDE